MGWFDYYRLIQKYGSVDKAPKAEREEAARWNPNTPSAARALAEETWKREQNCICLVTGYGFVRNPRCGIHGEPS